MTSLKETKDPKREWKTDSGFGNIFETKKEQQVDKVIEAMKGKDNHKNLWAVVFDKDLTKTTTEAVFTYEELTKSIPSAVDQIQQFVSNLITKSG